MSGVTRDRDEIGRTTAVAMAVAVAAIAVSWSVVNRSVDSLLPAEAGAVATVQAGTVELADDDSDSALFDLDAMVPGRPRESCIALTYVGSVVPAIVRATARVDGPLAEFLTVRVARGVGGGFEDCASFRERELLFEGSLQALGDTTSVEPIRVAEIASTPARMVIRIEVELADRGEAMGLGAAFDLDFESAVG